MKSASVEVKLRPDGDLQVKGSRYSGHVAIIAS